MPGTDEGLNRCGWGTSSAEYRSYHDSEWGRPVDDDIRVHEKLCLEGFQAGLSWLTVLRKREAFREVFAGFDPAAVARYGITDVERLAADTRIIRHRGKITAAITNAISREAGKIARMQTAAATFPFGLADGLVAVVKRDCPTCVLVAPVLVDLASRTTLTVITQDDPSFPEGIETVVDDTRLDLSWLLGVETVPTLVRVAGGREEGREVGWHRDRWEALTGMTGLGEDLPQQRPGCGSLTLEPGTAELLDVRHRGHIMRSRRVELSPLEDEFEAMWTRGWSDGIPVVPPTEARVLAMLRGTARAPDEVVAMVPPNLVPVTVEKVAVNAVMAGCRPEYLPVVLAAVEAACSEEFNLHGVLATTWSVGPVIIVNGPTSRAIGMNSGVNLFGQGNRANSTIGRALQLVVRNIGGGRPGGVDRATFGNPGKVGLCFAEDEESSPWEPLSVERGIPPGASAVTVLAGGATHSISDQASRTPETLARSLAGGLQAGDTLLVVSPDHGRVFRRAGWSKARLRAALDAEGGDLRADGRELLIAYGGGGAGLFSAAMEGWVGGAAGSIHVTREVQA